VPIFSYSSGQQKSSQVCDFSIFFLFSHVKNIKEQPWFSGYDGGLSRASRFFYQNESLFASGGSVLTRMVAFGDCKPLPRPRNSP